MAQRTEDIRNRPEFQQRLKTASEFYNVDQKLSPDDRKRVASSFNAPLIADPLVSLPALYAGINVPIYLKKWGYLDKNKATRGLSVFAGFAGLILGGNTGSALGYWYGDFSLADVPPARQAYRILVPYAPQIGRTYYNETAKDSSKIMPHPDSINWNKEIIFPYNLAFHIRRDQHFPTESSQHNGNNDQQPTIPRRNAPQQSQENQLPAESFFDAGVGEGNESDPFAEDESSNLALPQQSQQSSWDRIRSQSSGQPQGKAAPSRQNPSLPTPTISNSSIFGTSKLSERSHDYNETQQEFDQELEAERSGAGLQDDFSDSEKKWT